MKSIVNKKLNRGGGKSSIIDITPHNISSIDLDSSKSFYRGEVISS